MKSQPTQEYIDAPQYYIIILILCAAFCSYPNANILGDPFLLRIFSSSFFYFIDLM